jgi:AraC-like DNA-binding protein
MMLKEITPGPKLKPYVKSFYLYASDTDTMFDDIVFPSGNMEVIFNLGQGEWKIKKNNEFHRTPPIELWGQLTGPLPVRSVGRNIMLGIRFYPHSAAFFFNEDSSTITNEIIDGTELFGPTLNVLHDKLLSHADLSSRIVLIEDYLLTRLAITEKKHPKIRFVGEIAESFKSFDNNERVHSVSVRNKISPRYLNQLFLKYTGLTPKLYYKINRFQHSLNLINNQDQKLTSIGYDSGYFDQSHFIRDFKMFTGITPTSFSSQTLPINQILACA